MGIDFLNPSVLFALLAIPALWWLLRTVPPPPQNRVLATLRFLTDLPHPVSAPRAMPWWWRILRLMIPTALVFALATPLLVPQQNLIQSKTIRIIIDNSWAAQTSWDDQIRTARSLIQQTRSTSSTIDLATTAPEPGEDIPQIFSMLTPDQALQKLGDLRPKPWPATHAALIKALQNQEKTTSTATNIETFWLGHGIDEPEASNTLNSLLDQGPVLYFAPTQGLGPVQIARDPDGDEGNISITVRLLRPQIKETSLSLTGLDETGRPLATQIVIIPAGKTDLRVSWPLQSFGSLPPRFLQLNHPRGATSTLALDTIMARRHVTIIPPTQGADVTSLADPLYYLSRALSPYAALTTSSLADAFSKPTDVLIAPDLPWLDPDSLDPLLKWIKAGGLLLRFAGPQTATRTNPELSPLLLHPGERSLTGVSSWKTPPELLDFPIASPLYGLQHPEKIGLKTQSLAEPGTNPESVTWAQLTDGTPLITAKRLEKGLIVFIHTRADPSGSDLPLTGFYVALLKKVLLMSGAHMQTQQKGTTLLSTAKPWLEIDAAGDIHPSQPTTQNLSISQNTLQKPDAHHPPGLYARGNDPIALNLGETIAPISSVSFKGRTLQYHSYEQATGVINLQPTFLLISFALFLIDLVLLWGIQKTWRLPFVRPPALIFAFIILMLSGSPHAQAAQPDTGLVHLAYVSSGNANRDRLIESGLKNLISMIKQRTSINTGQVIQVNPQHDTLSLYPVVYWPVMDPNQTPLPTETIGNVQSYLRHGGLILFDTGDQSTTTPPIPTANYRALQSILNRLETGPLKPAPKDHVLRRSFYLLNTQDSPHPSTPDIWIQSTTNDGSDGVSSVVIISTNWSQTIAPPISDELWTGATPEQENAIRFGINIVMYALTGNYKSDQVHLPFILDRLRGFDASPETGESHHE